MVSRPRLAGGDSRRRPGNDRNRTVGRRKRCAVAEYHAQRTRSKVDRTREAGHVLEHVALGNVARLHAERAVARQSCENAYAVIAPAVVDRVGESVGVVHKFKRSCARGCISGIVEISRHTRKPECGIGARHVRRDDTGDCTALKPQYAAPLAVGERYARRRRAVDERTVALHDTGKL